jgi:hypothetical protein
MLPNRRRVRWLSANSSQQYRACFTSRPPVFTNRCCKPVSDHFSILFGSTKRWLMSTFDPDGSRTEFMEPKRVE